jgi:hypothetical protein
MLISTELLLNTLGNTVVERLKNDIKNKPVTKYGAVNASGKLYDSIRYEVTNNAETLRVYAEDYIDYLVYGRKPGKRPPRDVIRKWIDDKGLEPVGISKDSLAFLIARKIGEEGTTIYQQGGSTLLSDIITDNLIRETRDKLEDELYVMFKAELVGV